jgi:hypothetical protein
MDAGVEDANRRNVADAKILELYLDDEPRFVPAARLAGYTSVARLDLRTSLGRQLSSSPA